DTLTPPAIRLTLLTAPITLSRLVAPAHRAGCADLAVLVAAVGVPITVVVGLVVAGADLALVAAALAGLATVVVVAIDATVAVVVGHVAAGHLEEVGELPSAAVGRWYVASRVRSTVGVVAVGEPVAAFVHEARTHLLGGRAHSSGYNPRLRSLWCRRSRRRSRCGRSRPSPRCRSWG